jgi:nitrate reductase delta subunit
MQKTDTQRRTGLAKAGPLRFGAFKSEPGHREALARVQEWTRERFNLPHDATILVSEVECKRPGCPPLETVIAFWTEEGWRHHFKVFKPVAQVALKDLPPAWLRDALCASGDDELDCC